MKMVICGKGGSGKSTVAAMLSKSFAIKGYRVLLIDADESNLGLHRLLGISAPVVMMDSLGGKKGFREKSQGGLQGGSSGLFADALTFDDLAAHCGMNDDGIRLLSIGKIHEPGEGCACPMGSLSRMILSRLVTGEKDMVIIDTAAGVEHFGRGIDSHSDLVVGIIDPSFESVTLGEKMAVMAGKAGLPVIFILNRMTDAVKKLMKDKLTIKPIVAEIELDETIFIRGLEGQRLETVPKTVDHAADAIIGLTSKKRETQAWKTLKTF